MLGGSWVALSRVVSRITKVILHIKERVSCIPLITV